jgi:hypothetical protein
MQKTEALDYERNLLKAKEQKMLEKGKKTEERLEE